MLPGEEKKGGEAVKGRPRKGVVSRDSLREGNRTDGCAVSSCTCYQATGGDRKQASAMLGRVTVRRGDNA